jgi:diadenosine tetraphosphate (Ap4A) HIT family hydrolase
MAIQTDNIRRAKRFDWVLKGQSIGPRAPFDRDLFAFAEAAVSPTVGAITPGWLLLIPRTEACCVADLAGPVRSRVLTIADEVRSAMNGFGGRTFLFEHGARKAGSITGCGVDQAHLHLVNIERDFIKLVLSDDPSMHWHEVSVLDPWQSIEIDREYYFVADFRTAFVSYSITGKSQYFRKIVAREFSRPSEWDYRLFEHEQNARATASTFDGTTPRRSAA